MGLIDQLALRLAGAAGQYQQGRLKGEAVRYDRDQAAQKRQDALQQQALEQALLAKREAREASYDAQRQKLMDAQIADYDAQVKGVGRYAPKPERPAPGKWEKSVDRSGRVRYYNPETNETRDTPLTERVGGEGGGQIGWSFIQTDDGLKRGNSRTGQIEDVPGVTKTPASVQKELASLRALEADLAAAEQAAKGNSGAFSSSRLAIKGLKDVAPRAGSLVRTLTENMADPANSQARIIVAGVSNEALHKKYGSALSVNEIARSELDTPNVDGDDANQIVRKIAGMRANVQRRREALQGRETMPPPSTPSPAQGKSSVLDDLNALRGRP